MSCSLVLFLLTDTLCSDLISSEEFFYRLNAILLIEAGEAILRYVDKNKANNYECVAI